MFNQKRYNRQWHKNNPEKARERKEKWEKNNPEKVKECSKKWRKNNPEKTKEYEKQYHKDNSDKIKERQKKWYNNNIEKVREYQNQYQNHRYKIDLKYNLSRKMSRTIRKSLKGNKAGKHWEDLVGYTLNDLIKHLKKTMPEGYGWSDYLEGKLGLDHKIPISIFNYTNIRHLDFQRCWALKNLQLLPKEKNRIKRNKLNRPFQPSLKLKFEVVI